MDMIVSNGFTEISNVEDIEINGGGTITEIVADIVWVILHCPIILGPGPFVV